MYLMYFGICKFPEWVTLLRYIKEFVHGDFGRTKPNLGILLKCDVDILELDVEVSIWEIVIFNKLFEEYSWCWNLSWFYSRIGHAVLLAFESQISTKFSLFTSFYKVVYKGVCLKYKNRGKLYKFVILWYLQSGIFIKFFPLKYVFVFDGLVPSHEMNPKHACPNLLIVVYLIFL